MLERPQQQSLARDMDSEIPGVYWVDRLVTGSDWWTVGNLPSERGVRRYTLYAVKGGVGRSTSAAVLASSLAEQGEHVMVLDLDLESPGLSVGLLDPRKQPRYGIVDWFVEDLVGQGDHVVEAMVAYAWDNDFDGDVLIVPAHGADPGEYLAKLGRVYLDTNLSLDDASSAVCWHTLRSVTSRQSSCWRAAADCTISRPPP